MKILEQKIKSKEAKIAVIGLGYVGLPLAVEFAEAGFTVLGVDLKSLRGATQQGQNSNPTVLSA